MSGLKLARNLELPLDAATRRMAILAMSGAGKSNVAVRLAEQMYDAGIPWVAIDPKGDWWGVRVREKRDALSIPIFGGAHGDLPLEETAGAYLGRLIAEQRLTCILDVTGFDTRQQMWRFLSDFGTALFKHNRHALHLFLEEADEYIPQSTKEKGNLPKCLGVWQRVVKQGRTKGLGTTQITQRNASLNKDTLYMAELLIALRAVGKGDREAVKGWVEYHSAASDIVDSLPTLEDGEGWVSSPAWLRETKRVHFLRRQTYDSGATPVFALGKEAPAARLADVDLKAIQSEMADTIQRAKAEDPKELQKRIRDLEAQLRASSTPTLDLDRARREGAEDATGRLHALASQVDARSRRVADHLAAARGDLDRAGELLSAAAARLEKAEAEERSPVDLELPERPVVDSRPQMRRRNENTPHSRQVGESRSRAPRPQRSSNLTGPQQRVLDALAWWKTVSIDQPDKVQVGFVAGYRVGKKVGGTFGNVLGELRALELLDYPTPGVVALTEAGMAAAAWPEAPGCTQALHRMVRERLAGPEARVLDGIIAAYPDAIQKQRAGEVAGYTVGPKVGGTFGNILGRLRSLGLVDYPSPGQVRAADWLFL